MYDGGKRHKHNSGAAHLIRSNLQRMCASGLLPSWYAELQQKLVSSNRPRYFRLVCICTATSAFVMGIIIGLMIPMYLLPPSAVASAALLRPNHTTSSSTVPYPPAAVLDKIVTFDTVSFVPAVQAQQQQRRPSDSTSVNSSLIADGVYWSGKVEAALPRGFDSDSAADWRKFVRKARVVKIEEGCGRMQNRLVTFENGSTSCCRYRQNVDQIQGEIFSFYLGRYVLGLPNMTPATLSRVKPQTRQWSSVKAQLSVAQWAAEERAVVMTRFVPNLAAAYIPTFLRPSERRLHPPDLEDVEVDASELAQWSDLVIFDYLTANLDRVVNNLYNLQWNPTMMDAPAHNLAKDSGSGLLLFLDNESGLLHGYRLLEKYEHFHKAMLDALCIFRRSTADTIKRLHQHNNVGDLLRSAFKSSDPEFVDILPTLPEKSVKILAKRIARVRDQIVKCEAMYKST